MSAIIANFEITMKDGHNPSTAAASTNLNADRYSEIMPVERAFMGEIQLHWDAGPVGVWKVQVSNEFGSGDDRGVEYVNSNNIITKWAQLTTSTIGATDTHVRFAMADIGYRWIRLHWDSTSGTGDIGSFVANFKGY